MNLQISRKITKTIKRMPGAVLFLEPVRRRYLTLDETVRIADFDGDIKVELDLNEHMASRIFWYGSYSRDILITLSRLLKPGMVMFDIGANIGEITLFAAKLVGSSGRVHAFEPMASLADKLRSNIALNSYTQVQAVELAVSAAPGIGSLFRNEGKFSDGSVHSGLGTLHPYGTRVVSEGEVHLISVDAYCADHGVERLDAIKIDVEGSELAALRGAANTIERLRPSIIVEVNAETSRAAGYEHTEILRVLMEHKYIFKKIGRKGRLTEIAINNLDPFSNVLCMPGGKGG